QADSSQSRLALSPANGESPLCFVFAAELPRSFFTGLKLPFSQREPLLYASVSNCAEVLHLFFSWNCVILLFKQYFQQPSRSFL
ncbi:MAG: hypothetical protein IJD81_03160, partial [Oscillospiraceae bacterium]|nr:hypothetical protein [Oscillospiraceae bacterium]